jgi:MATE family multidrug resistance protein
MAIGVGATAVVARNIGAGDLERASRTLHTALVMSAVWGLVSAAAMWLGSDVLLRLMGAEPEALDPGGIYMRAAAYGLPAYSMIYAGTACMQGAGDTRTPMMVILVVNAVNAVVAYVLIYGPGPFPAYGVIGSGLGFTSGAAVGGVMVLAVLRQGRGGIRFEPSRALEVDRGEMGRITNVGLPAGLEQFQFIGGFLIYTRIISSLGTDSMAAHQVALRVEGLAFYPGFALGIAAMAMVGQSLGAQRPDLAEKSAAVAARWAVIFMTTMGVILLVFGGPITALFAPGEEEVIEKGRWLLFIFAFAMPGMAISQSLAGGLRGAGDTRAVLGMSAFGLWVVRLVPAYLLAIVLGLGVVGAWGAAVMDINTRGALIWLRFRQGKWKSIRV